MFLDRKMVGGVYRHRRQEMMFLVKFLLFITGSIDHRMYYLAIHLADFILDSRNDTLLFQ